MNGRKSKALRKATYGRYKKRVTANKVTLWTYIKTFLTRKRPLKELKPAWMYRKWWNSLGIIRLYRFREYMRASGGSRRNKGLRLQYLIFKKAFQMEKDHGR